MKIRLIGLELLAVSAIAIHLLYGLVHAGVPHQASAAELSLAFVIVVTGLGGVLMVAAGMELFRPPRS